jgi:hypothetical protein
VKCGHLYLFLLYFVEDVRRRSNPLNEFLRTYPEDQFHDAVNSAGCVTSSGQEGRTSMRLRSLVLGGAAAVAVILAAAVPASAATASRVEAGSGSGGAAAISVSPGTLTFGPQEVGTSSAGQVVTVTNTGSASESIYVSFASAGGTSGGDDFRLVGDTACGEPDTLAPGASCSDSIAFEPITTGTLDASMNVSVNSFDGTPVASASLTGTAFDGPSASELTISPASLSFAPRFILTGASAPQTVTVTNTSSQPAFISNPGAGDQFGISSTTCDSVTLAVGASCTVAVTFVPSSPGTISGALSVQVGSYPDESSLSIPLTGEGLGQVVNSITVSADTVASGGTVTGTVKMGVGACTPVNAATTVDLTAKNSAISVPAQVVVPEGQCMVSFLVTANQVSAATTSGFTAIDANEKDPGKVNLVSSPAITVEP